MRYTSAILSGLALLVLAPFAFADASGNWKWTISTQDGNTIDMAAKFTQKGEDLSGVFLDGFDQQKFDVKDGHVKGDQITFTITRPLGDATITVNYAGKLDADTIKGTLEVKFGDQEPMKSDWVAKRVKEDATTQPSTQPAGN